MEKTFGSNKDFYQYLDEIIAQMELLGFRNEANSISFLLHSVLWTTTSELFHELGNAIVKVLAVPSLPAEIRLKLEHCAVEVGAALPGTKRRWSADEAAGYQGRVAKDSEKFSIRILTDDRGPDGERLGEIRIGSFVERFGVYPPAGGVDVLTTIWLNELRLLVAGGSAVGLTTASNMAWVLYRLDDDVKVHQTLMSPDFGPKLLPDGSVTDIPAYSSKNGEGERISEWSTSVGAIRAFLSEYERATTT